MIHLIAYSAHQGSAHYKEGELYYFTEYPYTNEFTVSVESVMSDVMTPDVIPSNQDFGNFDELVGFLKKEYMDEKRNNKHLPATQKLLKKIDDRRK